MELPINDQDLDTIVNALALGGDARLYHLLKKLKMSEITILTDLIKRYYEIKG